jgi:hypothetical protein
MKKTTVFILLISAVSLAQKVEPPPTKIELPGDTTSQVDKQNQKLKAETNLQLPDVVIFGEDKSSRYAGSKKNIAPRAPAILAPVKTSSPATAWFSAPDKPSLKSENPPDKPVGWAQLLAGSYNTILTDAGGAIKMKNIKTRMNAWYDKSKGQYVNSDYTKAGLDAGVRLQPMHHTLVQVNGYFNHDQSGVYGAPLPDLTRFVNHGHLTTRLKLHTLKHTRGEINAQIGDTKLHSDTSSTELEKAEDFWYRFYGDFSVPWKGIDWSVKSEYMHNQYRTGQDSSDALYSTGWLAFESLIPFSSRYSALLGIRFHQVKSDSFSRADRVSPYARFNAAFSDRVGLLASVESGYRIKRFTDWWMQNRFASVHIPLRPEEIDYAIQAEAIFEIFPSIKFHTALERTKLLHTFYRERSKESGFIVPQIITDVELTEIKIGVSVDISNRSYLHLFYIDYSDNVKSISVSPVEKHIPYRPNYRIPLYAEFKLPYGFFFSTTTQFVGKRRTSLIEETELDEYILVDAMITKAFDRFSLTLSADNLLDQTYQRWQGYPENGISVFGGIVVKL